MYQPRPPRMPFNQPYRMQHHPQNPNFSPRGRGRGPRHGYNPNFRGPPPTAQNTCEDYWCETCDRGFTTQHQLETHKQQHQKCNIDGCQFVAHPKVVTKHIQMQHSTGLFKKIANLNNPEEIQKWREERKRRFPTKENIEKKAAEIKEKIERGEKMGLQKNRHFNNDASQKRRHFNGNEANDSKRIKIANQDITNSNTTDTKNKKRNRKQKKQVPEKPIEECKVNPVDTSPKTEEPAVCSALSTLMCEYGSSDEESEMQAHQNESPASENIKNVDGKTEKPNTVQQTNTENKESVHSNDKTNHKTNALKQEIKEINHAKEIKNESDNEAPQEEKVKKAIASIDDAKDTETKRTKSPKLYGPAHIDRTPATLFARRLLVAEHTKRHSSARRRHVARASAGSLDSVAR
ncbi:nuclear fragile X mental retardation-interacting protein 1 (NUFIP1) domain-containing protein [Phthorimaea operculella]|nr:nuclear fragile X mental retardation-interacting protein 1 (NUFIP1) domain-containing protein [Phthorimaea operculella]